jgi:hypothetical protein
MPGGNPADMAKGMWNVESVQLIQQHKQKIQELEQQKEQKEKEKEQLTDQIKQVESQLDQNSQQLDQIKDLQEQGQAYDSSGLEQQKEQLHEQKRDLEQSRAAIEEEIAAIENEISVEENAISKLKGDVWQERKLAAASMVPEAGVAAMAAQQAMHMKHQHDEAGTASKEQGAEQKIGQADSKAQSAGASAASAGQAASAAKASAPTHTPGPKSPSGGGGAGGGSGLSKIAEKAMGPKGESEGTQLPLPTLLGVITSVVAGGYIWKSSGTAEPMTMVWVLLPIVALVAALIILAETKGHRGKLATLLIVLLFVGAAYGLTTRTVPFIIGAWRAGNIEDTAGEIGSLGKGAGIGVTTDFRTSFNQYMASATGERIEGDVDQQVKEEVGIEILPPYLPNPKRLNINELRGLEFGARVKGFDPKNVMNIAAVCHTQTRSQAQDFSRAWSESGKGPNTNPGTEERIRPTSFSGNNFDRDVTCFPEISGCDHYITTISAQADHLRTDAQMQNYIIDKEVMRQRLENYAKSYSKEIKSQSQLDSAVNEIYKGQLGSYKSVSDKAAIKVVMATQPVALIGVDQETELVLKAGVENMMAGWIRDINRFEITMPEYFSPMTDYCEAWEKDGNKLRLRSDYLNTSSIRQTAKGEQKVFPSCRLVPSGDYALTEPTEATFLASVDYNYLVQEEYELEVRNEDGTSCNARTSSGGGSSSGGTSGTAKAPSTTKEGTASDSNEVTPEQLAAYEQSVELCRDKNEGDSCGNKQFCLTKEGALECWSECIYYADKSERGLNPSYDCIRPSSACNPAAIRAFSCVSPMTQGTGWACCIERT